MQLPTTTLVHKRAPLRFNQANQTWAWRHSCRRHQRPKGESPDERVNASHRASIDRSRSLYTHRPPPPPAGGPSAPPPPSGGPTAPAAPSSESPPAGFLAARHRTQPQHTSTPVHLLFLLSHVSSLITRRVRVCVSYRSCRRRPHCRATLANKWATTLPPLRHTRHNYRLPSHAAPVRICLCTLCLLFS